MSKFLVKSYEMNSMTNAPLFSLVVEADTVDISHDLLYVFENFNKSIVAAFLQDKVFFIKEKEE